MQFFLEHVFSLACFAITIGGFGGILLNLKDFSPSARDFSGLFLGSVKGASAGAFLIFAVLMATVAYNLFIR